MHIASKKWYPSLAIAVLFAGAAWIWLSALPPGGVDPGRQPAPRAGFPAPDFTLATAAGDEFTLSELRGRPVLINLWASWCGPCRTEMPAIERVYRAYRDEGLVVLAVNVTHQDSQQAALAFAAEYGLTFPILLDLDGQVARAYQMRALPSTYFVDPSGRISEVVIGGPMAEALLRTRVEQLAGWAR